MSTALTQSIQQKFARHVLAAHHYRGQETVLIRREGLPDVARFLRDDPAAAFDFLMDLSCVDYLKFGKTTSSAPTLATPSPLPYFMKPKALPEKWERPISAEQYRFDAVYHFFSSATGRRFRLKVAVSAVDPQLASVSSLWATANWFEREVWDMFGIQFTGHPNLKRILMYEGFEGHPLRKDYPINRRQPLVGPLD